MRYSRTLNYYDRITLFDLTHKMSMADPIAIDVETLMINNRRSLKKDFTKLICINI